MILVKRTKVPRDLKSSKIKLKIDEMRVFFKSKKKNAQKRFNFNLSLINTPSIKSDLHSMFKGKCAYCESKTSDAGNIDHFRPINGALGLLKENFSKDHYWWLAYEWSNLYLSCQGCNLSKGNRFPIQGNRSNQNTSTEQILLIDPCGDEDPSLHLSFTEDGFVSPITYRGKITIDTFGLNRVSLVEQRRLHAHKVKLAIEQRKTNSPTEDKYFQLEESTFSLFTDEYLALTKQLLRKFTKQPLAKSENARAKNFNSLFTESQIPKNKLVVPKIYLGPRNYTKIVIPPINFDSLTEKGHPTPPPAQQARLIERVRIRNFKAIEDITISFEGGAEDKNPWHIFLGENGAGKSSILQAISLTLAGETNLKNLNLDAKSFAMKHKLTSDTSVEVFLTGMAMPYVLRIDGVQNRFHVHPIDPDVTLFGFGATRLLGVDINPADSPLSNIENMFNPKREMSGIDDWMCHLPEETFDQVARSLKDILALEGDGYFIRKNNNVLFSVNKSEVSLKYLSDGYQSLIALCGYLMKQLLSKWPSLDVAEGIVLIDELGLHMHPSWKMRIVSSMRSALPRLQVIATTHEPLCLRGLKHKEVSVVKRRGKELSVFINNDLPPTEHMRIDQILTSEHFGLNSTVDPELELMYGEYYSLLNKKSPSKEQKQRIKEIRKTIDSATVLGGNRRERLALQVIDETLAKEEESATFTLRESTKRKVLKILGEV